MQQYILAIDGGGTKCKATLFTEAGKVLAESVTGPANIFRDMRGAQSAIIEAAECCVSAANQNLVSSIQLQDLVVCAACAGANIAGAVADFEAWQHPFKHCMIISDLLAACLAANNSQDCAVLIVGTGSSFANLRNGQLEQLGGHGFQLGDDASGAYIGKQAIMTLLKIIDGIYQDDVFRDACIQATRCNSAQQIVARYSTAAPSVFGELAPLIFTLHSEGNKTATIIIAAVVEYLLDVEKTLRADSDHPLFITGGLAKRYVPLLKGRTQGPVMSMQNPPELGAFHYAIQAIK